MRDDLRTWLTVRAGVAWDEVPDVTPRTGADDGVAEFVDTIVRRRDEQRAERLLAALAQVRADAGRPLTFDLLAGWQELVLGEPAAFRTTTAFAKGGRERYGPTTPEEFDAHLADAHGTAPLPARVARAYLDVCFFHPFPDGNGRAAMLAAYHLLTSDGVTLDRAGPLFVISRRADDAAGAAGLARLVGKLVAG